MKTPTQRDDQSSILELIKHDRIFGPYQRLRNVETLRIITIMISLCLSPNAIFRTFVVLGVAIASSAQSNLQTHVQKAQTFPQHTARAVSPEEPTKPQPDHTKEESSKVNQVSWPMFLPLVTAIGAAMFTYFLTSASSHRFKRLEIKLSYVQSQLDEFYGPLLGECLRTDAMFVKTEEAIAVMFPDNDHHHTNLARLLRLPREETGPISPREDLATFSSHIVEDVYALSNREKLTLLKDHVHLYGPHPPSSFLLFMSHAAQVEAILKIWKNSGCVAKDQASLAAETINMVVPFPTPLTAEVFAKVSYLKCLQRELRYRISHRWLYFLRIGGERVFSRKQYFLKMPERTREELSNSVAIPHFYDKLPLLWGPYTAVELIELKAWFMNAEMQLSNAWRPELDEEKSYQDGTVRSSRATTCLKEQFTRQLRDQIQFISLMLVAKVVYVHDEGEPIPESFRGLSGFDVLAPLAFKQGMRWSVTDGGTLKISGGELQQRFSELQTCGCTHTLSNLPDGADFAYEPNRFRRMRSD